MVPLSKILKDIYTSGDKMTVLQLLRKMIDEIENYEVDTIQLYRHLVQIRTVNGSLLFVSYSANSTPVTMDTPTALDNLIPEARTKYYPCVGYYKVFTEGEGYTFCTMTGFKYNSGLGQIHYEYNVGDNLAETNEAIIGILDIVTDTLGGVNQ